MLTILLALASYDAVIIEAVELELKALHYQCVTNMNPNACRKLRVWLHQLERQERDEGLIGGSKRI
jgi:hypothetical protein